MLSKRIVSWDDDYNDVERTHRHEDEHGPKNLVDLDDDEATDDSYEGEVGSAADSRVRRSDREYSGATLSV